MPSQALPRTDTPNANATQNATAEITPGNVPLEVDIADMAVIEAMLDHLANQQNVWEYIDRIENQYRIPAEHRQHYYEQFITMVASRPQAEQDALLDRAHGVFRYRAETARADVKRLRAQGGSDRAIKIAPSVVDDTLMAEIVHCANH